MTDKLKILFMGTPDFASCSLATLLDAGYDVAGAVTQPDKPRGRHMEMAMSSVKMLALERNIAVYQPQTLRGEQFAALLGEIAPNVIIVAAYGKLLPQNVLDYPKYGCINIHGSLLPKYRGAAPIQRAIIDGEAVTGITTMRMDSGIDTGDMLLRAETAIADDDNFETLHDRLAGMGAHLLVETLHELEAGTLVQTPQGEGSTYAAKIENADCELDFGVGVREVFNRIRGLSPFPLAYTTLPDGKKLKIVSARPGECRMPPREPAGIVAPLDGDVIRVACADGYIEITSVIPEGKGKMSAKDFINGRKIKIGDRLGGIRKVLS
ncbi:MAG: methionyl-tRNA formyltransferase [Eubacteriales bacterium]